MPTMIRIPDDLCAAIDRERGDIPRERWIRRVLAERLHMSANGQPKDEPR